MAISVLYVVGRCRPGGSWTLTAERIRRLDGSRIRPNVCALLPTVHDVAGVLEEWDSLRVPVHVLGHRGRADAPRTVRSLIGLSGAADVIHNVNAPYSYVAAAALMARRPLINDLISTARPGWSERLAEWSVTANLAVSHAVATAHGARRTSVIYPPLQLDAPTLGAPRRSAGDAPTVLVVGRFSAYKGMEFLPRIVKALIERVPRARVIVAGDGPGRAELERRLASAGAASSVSLLGFRNDVRTLHASADVYLSTSEAEGLVGYATLEAAVAGTPIVAAAIPAVSEVLRNGQDAILVSPRDPEAVADGLSAILSDRNLADRLAASAAQRVRELLAPELAVADLMAFYESLAFGASE